MVKHKFSRRYAELLAEKLMEIGNASLISVVVVQFIPGQIRSVYTFVLGLVTTWVFHIFAYFIFRQGGDE
jgi:hypothetical protein